MENPTWPAGSLVAVVPSDATVFLPSVRQIYVGGAGNIVVETDAGQTVTFSGVSAGAHIGPFFVRKIKAATTATLLIAYI
jgi:hypothetical protein